MKFYGNGIVWDKSKNKALCTFKDGQLDTEDVYIIEKLKESGYKFDQENNEIEIEEKKDIKPLLKGGKRKWVLQDKPK